MCRFHHSNVMCRKIIRLKSPAASVTNSTHPPTHRQKVTKVHYHLTHYKLPGWNFSQVFPSRLNHPVRVVYEIAVAQFYIDIKLNGTSIIKVHWLVFQHMALMLYQISRYKVSSDGSNFDSGPESNVFYLSFRFFEICKQCNMPIYALIC